MKKNIFLFLIPIVFISNLKGQDFKKDFIPNGFQILDYKKGNLNLDQYEDYIVILKKIDEEKTSDVINNPEKRPLFILIGKANNTFEVISKNDNCVYCIDCGGMMGDPYVGITIKKGFFTIEHYGGSSWRWSHDITFKYSKKDKFWFLYKLRNVSFNVGELEKVKVKVKRKKDFGKIPFDKYDIYRED